MEPGRVLPSDPFGFDDWTGSPLVDFSVIGSVIGSVRNRSTPGVF